MLGDLGGNGNRQLGGFGAPGEGGRIVVLHPGTPFAQSSASNLILSCSKFGPCPKGKKNCGLAISIRSL